MLSLEEQPIKGDQIFRFDSIEILIHENDKKHFLNQTLDFIRDEFGNGRFQLI